MAQSNSDSAHIAYVLALLQDYLQIIPEEALRIPVLLKQLQEGDLALTDRKNLLGHLTASALVLDSTASQILLIEHKSLARWLQPGGHLDANEFIESGARRELAEETGLTAVKLIAPLPFDVDSHEIPVNQAKGEGAHLHHDFQYLYQLTEPAIIALQENEVAQFKWVELEALETGEYGRRLSRVAGKLRQLSLVSGAKS